MIMEEKKKEEVTEDKVFRALRKQLLATPYSAPLHYNLGLAYARRGQLDESITCFQQAIVYDPKLVETYINLGGIYLRKGNIEACIEANQKALEINPNHPLAHSRD
jgi:tetratricopeptide (TPR) repeat protein